MDPTLFWYLYTIRSMPLTFSKLSPQTHEKFSHKYPPTPNSLYPLYSKTPQHHHHHNKKLCFFATYRAPSFNPSSSSSSSSSSPLSTSSCMAVSFLRYEVSDLCLAKPALRSLSASATVADALEALKTCEENFISVWDCNHSKTTRSLEAGQLCRCVGKVCMVDVICYLCKDDNLVSPSAALKAPVSAILSKIPGQVMHVEPSCRY